MMGHAGSPIRGVCRALLLQVGLSNYAIERASRYRSIGIAAQSMALPVNMMAIQERSTQSSGCKHKKSWDHALPPRSIASEDEPSEDARTDRRLAVPIRAPSR